jgi:hypothetical protein
VVNLQDCIAEVNKAGAEINALLPSQDKERRAIVDKFFELSSTDDSWFEAYLHGIKMGFWYRAW